MQELRSFNEISTDSDSDDDIPLAKLRPLKHVGNREENNEGSTSQNTVQYPDVVNIVESEHVQNG